MQNKKGINIGKTGMNRNTAPHLLQEGEYVFQLNGNNESVIGDRLNNMNEPSNLLCLNFPTGYKVVGYKNDINSDNTYYFLTNPSTGYSKFGYISNIQNLTSVDDLEELECDGCNYRAILEQPLENQSQIASCTFVELLDDSCNKGFNFDINHPIKKIEIKSEKCGKTIYFTDYLNPPRYIRLDDIPRYTTDTILEDCGEETTAQIEPTRIISYSCPEGYTYDSASGTCIQTIVSSGCPEGYTYNPNTGFCEGGAACLSDIVIILAYNENLSGTAYLSDEMEALALQTVANISSQLTSDRYRVSVIKTGANGNVTVATGLTNAASTINTAITSTYARGTGPDFIGAYCQANTILTAGRASAKKNIILIGYSYTQNYDNTCLGCAEGTRVEQLQCVTEAIKTSGAKSIVADIYGDDAFTHGSINFYLGGNPSNTSPAATTPTLSSDPNGNFGYATYIADPTAPSLPDPVDLAPFLSNAIECSGTVDQQPVSCVGCTNNNNGTCTCTDEVAATETIEYICTTGTLNEATNKCEYTYTTINDCGCETEVSTCLNSDKLRMFPLHSDPEIDVENIVLGGRLKMGTYEFLICYCDNLGNELTEYRALTNPVSIFDQNNNILQQQELADRTPYAIKLQVKDLDTSYRYYKVAVIQTADIQGASRYFEEGVHPIGDKSVLYTTEENKKEITLDDLFRVRPNITKVEGLSQANNILFLNGLDAENEWNLQPVVNLMGSFLRWQTAITSEGYYRDGTSSAKGKGYHRDEVSPFAIRFGSNTGYTTALFPLVGRPATAAELLDAPANNDYLSINTSSNECVGIDRTKTWQIYNTAEELGSCITDNIPTNTITEPVTKTSVTSLGNTGPGCFLIEDADNFISLETYINDALEQGCSGLFPACFGQAASNICTVSDPASKPDNIPTFENCDTPEKVGEDIVEVLSITGESLINNYISFPDEYSSLKPQQACSIYAIDTNGNYLTDTEERDIFFPGVNQFRIRQATFTNIKPRASYELQPVQDPTVPLLESFFHDWLTAHEATKELSIAKLQETGFVGAATDGDSYSTPFPRTWVFTSTIHKNGLWFEVDLDENPNIILEITKGVRGADTEDLVPVAEQVRVSFFEYSTPSTALYSFIYRLRREGQAFDIKYNPLVNNLQVIDKNSSTIINEANFRPEFNSKKLYMVIDCPITFGNDSDNTTSAYVAPERYCFGVGLRNYEIDYIEASYEDISFQRIQKWEAPCQFEIPVVNNCDLIPYKYGKFGYWESTETYPDNTELFDSSGLDIATTDIPAAYLSEFTGYYAQSVIGTDITLSPQADFRCKPIRHYKFPDNKVAPFMWENKQAPFVDSLIFPLGVTLDNDIINAFLDIAVKNNLITQEQRNSVDYYEIFKGDRRLEKSVVAKGLMYDTYEYKEDGKTIKYPNYPYNDLGEDVLHYSNDGRTVFIQHPYNSESNNSWTVHTPETDYTRPDLPTELKVEGYMFGNSRGHFDNVENHPEWVILGKEARRKASKLATLETLAEAAIAIAESSEVYRVQFGVANSVNPVGIALNIAVAVTQVLSSLDYKYGRYRYQWLESFRNLGSPKNFAYFYSSEGFYNYFQPLQEQGDQLRGLTMSKYLKEGKFYFTNEAEGTKTEINNINRERSVYLEVSKNYNIEYPSDYYNYDNSDVDRSSSSRTYLSKVGNCTDGRSIELVKNIASPYVSLKVYNPSQFGTLDSIKWLTTSFKGDLRKGSPLCNLIFGGDVFISRHTLKRKIPMFLRDAMDVPSLTPFPYKTYSNIGTEPRFFCNYEVTDNINLDRGFPELKSEYSFDCLTGERDFYIKEPTKFYLYYYGIPNFLCETEINTNYRYGRTEPKDNFYPNVGDFMDWTQEKNVGIREPNTFYYNPTYSKTVTSNIYRTLPSFFSQEEFDCRYDSPNGVMYSQPDYSENDLIDPWLVFKPLDRYEFPTSFGKLIDLVGVQDEQILARFEDQKALFNAYDTLVDDGQNPQRRNLGSGGIFATRPRTFSKADLGVLGTQHTEYVLTPYGLFDVDAKRGKVYQFNGQAMEEISSFINGKPSGMRNWFREHLPFKILKKFPEADVDNKFKSIGLSLGWDARFDRVFITKKDYVPVSNDLYYSNGEFRKISDDSVVSLKDTQYFKDVSWTLAYKPVDGQWVSYYSFHPDIYVNHHNYFQTGLNYSSTSSEIGLWSHLLTERSFCVFYGKKYPWILEVPFKNENANKLFQSFEISTEAKRYDNSFGFNVNRYMTFNRATIYNNTNNSGTLNLVPQKHSLAQNSKYPITNSDNTQDILITSQDEDWNINYFYNRVKNDTNNIPMFIKDENDINKTVNPKVVGFHGKKSLERFRGDWAILHLEFDQDSRYNLMYKMSISNEQVY